MAPTRIRKFNTRDTYPERKLDNDLCQAVVTRGGTTIYLRGQCPQDLDTFETIPSHDPAEQTHKVMRNIKLLIEECGGTMEHLGPEAMRAGRTGGAWCVASGNSDALWRMEVQRRVGEPSHSASYYPVVFRGFRSAIGSVSVSGSRSRASKPQAPGRTVEEVGRRSAWCSG